MSRNNFDYKAYWIIFLALLGACLGYAMGLNDREEYLTPQIQQETLNQNN